MTTVYGDACSGARVLSQRHRLASEGLARLAERLFGDCRYASLVRLTINSADMARAVNRTGAGVVNLHNIHDACTFSLLRTTSLRTPIVWTLHDMWPLTGYCCYSYGCPKFTSGCTGDCPQRGAWGPAWRSPAAEWGRRSTTYAKRRSRLTFVAPSRWMEGLVRARFGNGFNIRRIPNGLDLDVFRPTAETRVARRALQLPDDGKIIVTAAHWAEDPRKGADLLRAAVGRLRAELAERVIAVCVGETMGQRPVMDGWFHTGLIRDEALMNLYYNAADVFVLPTRADNLPNTLVEATAAGIPCVAFDVGGCSDVVKDGRTGYLAKPENPNSLADCIMQVLVQSPEERAAMSRACRNHATASYSMESQAKAYIALFDEMTGRASR